jgi:hypothetical protein
MKSTKRWSQNLLLVMGLFFATWSFLISGCGRESGGTSLVLAADSPTDLAGLTQNWDKVLPVAIRFVVLADFAGAAVRDNETGLVWERTPAMIQTAWSPALCLAKTVGGRKGLRLPSGPELATLVDPSVPPLGPTLPSGHPFTTVQSSSYWSATTNVKDPNLAYIVNFIDGGTGGSSAKATFSLPSWCVRGPMNADQY